MATIKSYTDIEQSRKLAEILPLESADNYYTTFYGKVDKYLPISKEVYDIIKCPINMDKIVPAWSLAALFDTLSYPQLSKDKLGNGKEGWMVSDYPNNCRYDSCWHDNPIDACYELILKLYELNLL